MARHSKLRLSVRIGARRMRGEALVRTLRKIDALSTYVQRRFEGYGRAGTPHLRQSLGPRAR